MTLLTEFRRQAALIAALSVLVAAGFLHLAGRAALGEAAITWYSLGVALVLAVGMIRDIMAGRYGVDILAVMAIVSTLMVGEYWATIVIVIMMVGGEALESFANARARSELSALITRAPTVAHKQMVDGSTGDVAVTTVQPNDTIVVRPGEVVPVDGVIVSGNSMLDESSITGESEPVAMGKGENVLSGSVNGESPITIRVERSASDSQYAQIVALVQAASESKAPFVRLADRYAVPFTFAAIGIALIAWMLSGDARRFAEVLVVATPCPLLLAAPVAFISGMSRAAKQGIIMKNGSSIERLSTVRSAAFDKTGTLTKGELELVEIIPQKTTNKEEVLAIAASAEQQSGHVTARAIQIEATRRLVEIRPATGISEVSGGGILCTIGHQKIVVGRRNFLVEHGVPASSLPEYPGTATYVARSNKLLGVIIYKDTVRQDAAETLRQLRQLGVKHVVMLTGDHPETAYAIAAELGMTDVRADCLPKDKVAAVRDFEPRPIMMTGDGVNDAPVLAASDVGIAMGARGATAASESADVVIMVDQLSRLVSAIKIARHTVSVAKRSVLIGIGLSIFLMLLAATGRIPAVVGASLQEVVDIIVILYALRARAGSLNTKVMV